VEEVGSSGKVSLSEKIVLVLLAVEVGAVKEGFGFFAIEASSRPCHQGVYHQDVWHQGVCRFLKQAKAASTTDQVKILSWLLLPVEPSQELMVLVENLTGKSDLDL
jgi:hypothetical protein